ESFSDKYEDSIGTYLMKITRYELTPDQNTEVSKFLHTLSDFERLSDHALNIAVVAKEIHDKGVRYSPEASHELEVVQKAILEIVSIAVNSFIDNDLNNAAKVEPLEEVIDSLCDELKLHHVDRLQKGICTLEQGFTFNDLLTNYERVSDHCSNIALAMIELETDAFNTHEYLRNIEEIKQQSFTEHLEEFRIKYSL
ncbi:MAG: Na/Pi cotransporter family protein, partial [Oscillospiraceae bacterium]|nr:Na/Pi cotransporter family protein [Oscillospiraceae bacterium]